MSVLSFIKSIFRAETWVERRANEVELELWKGSGIEIKKLRKKYWGKKLTEQELEDMPFLDKLAICKCDVQIPGPVFINPECPVHWDIAD